jgi:hypothetical protein
MCCDHTSELADISVGDPWNLGVPEGIGSSIVVARTKKGQSVLCEASADGSISLESATARQVKQSQLQMLYFKKKGVQARLKFYRNKARIDADLLDPDFSDHFLALAPCLVSSLSQNVLARMLVRRLPQGLLLLYTLPLNRLWQKKLQKWKVT